MPRGGRGGFRCCTHHATLDVRLRLLNRSPAAQALDAGALASWRGDVTARIDCRGGEIRPESRRWRADHRQTRRRAERRRFIIRDQSALRTIGGGAIVDPYAHRQRRDPELRAAQLDALGNADPAQALGALQACSPAGVDLSWFGRTFNLDDGHLAALAQRNAPVVIGKEPRMGLPRAAVEAIKTNIRQALARFHAETPQALGIEIAALRKQCAPNQATATFPILLRLLADEKHIELSGSVARLPRHVATDNPPTKEYGSACSRC